MGLPVSDRLTELEQVIGGGLRTFVEVGRALMEIRDAKLYKAEFDSFENYCAARWQIDKPYAHRLICASEIHEILVPIGTAPANESTARALMPIFRDYRDQLPAAWDAVVKRAPVSDDGTPIITAKHVEAVVADFLPREVMTLTPGNGCTIDDLEGLVSVGQKFGTIYVDPPWAYDNRATRSAADGEYTTMTIDELCALPVAALAADESHLHLWTTNAFLFDAKRLIDEWGFIYKSCFVWVKPRMGIGNYWRVSHEFMLLGVRGGLTFAAHDRMSWRELPRGRHSEKPDQIRQDIEAVSPGPRIELFARTLSPGWTCWGNEIERTLLCESHGTTSTTDSGK